MNPARFVWLASYPRSGNTWLRLLLESAATGGAPVDIGAIRLNVPVLNRAEFEDLLAMDPSALTPQEIDEARPELYAAIAANFEGSFIRRKVHEKYRLTPSGRPVFPAELSHTAIYIVRDPRDVAVSYAAFSGCDIDMAVARMADPGCIIGKGGERYHFPEPLGTWSEHVQSWLDQTAIAVFLLRYEDLLADTAGWLENLAAYAGVPAADTEQAAHSVNFTNLQAQEECNGFAEKPSSAERFFRSGRAGGWLQILNTAQCERIERDHGPMMRRLGYL